MIAPGNSIVQITLGLAFVIASGYALGRIHQWYRYGNERDQYYRDGYDEASQSMFDMAVSTRVSAVGTEPTVPIELLTPVEKPAPANDIRPSRHRQSNLKPVIAKPSHVAVGATRRRIVAAATNQVTGQRRHRATI